MTLSDISIRRPVLTWMMTLALISFGILGFLRLGVDQFPKMDLPVVVVTTVLEGASPEVVEEDVTDVLEQHINTLAGLRTIRSTTQHGVSSISAKFELGRDIDHAAQDLRDKVALARRQLPRDAEPPVIEKVDPGDFPVLWIPISSNRPATELTEYIRYNVEPLIETISGVGAVDLFGPRDRNIRIWIDGHELRARNLTAMDLMTAIRREHIDAPSGQVESRAIEYAVKTDAEFRSVKELENLIISGPGNSIVRLRDVARVEDGADDIQTIAHFNGVQTVGLGIRKQSGANTVAITDEAYARVDMIREVLPDWAWIPNHDQLIDYSLAIRESVEETEFALLFGALLATLTVFLFLRRLRPTLIIGAAIPISLIATFGVMWILGFTLNVMTLLALTLAVGVVIDDAIVVLENIERHREMGKDSFHSASDGTRQITPAATAATLSVAAVFLPCAALEGLVGSFLREFGLTVAAAVLLSLFVALTLTPMLSARIPAPGERRPGVTYQLLGSWLKSLERRYSQVLDWALAHRGTTFAIAFLSLFFACGSATQLGVELFPPEDQGRFFGQISTPPGTSLEKTLEIFSENESWALDQPEIAGLFSAVGVGGPGRPGSSNSAIMFAVLKPRAERDRSAHELIEAAREAFDRIPGQRANIFDMSTVGGGESQSDFSFNIQGSLELAELDQLADEMIRELESIGGIVDLDKSLKLGLPELRVVPDREKAAALGVDAASVATTVRAMVGGVDIATFKEGGHRYDIRLRLEPEYRAKPDSIQRLYVRGNDGTLSELSNLVSIETGAAASQITRTNRQRSVSVQGNLQDMTLGEAIAHTEQISARVLGNQATLSFSGQAEQLQESVSQFALMIGLSILVIYMVLAAQFESLLHPLTVMLALPFAMVGALGGLLTFGMTLNLFSMIGIILLFGLVTKNSILLVDYANQLRAEGMEKLEAMRKAAPVRMRPVLMTAISMIFGVLPAAIGVGPGAESRQPMAITTAAGMLTSMLLTLVIVPVFYLSLEDGVDWLKATLGIGRGDDVSKPEARDTGAAL